MGVVLKTSGDPSGVMKQVEQQVRTLDPQIAIRNLQPLESYIDDARAPMRFNLILIAIFGIVALTLASVGLYSVMAYSVTQRSHELGIRIAVGASPRDILRLVLGQGSALDADWSGFRPAGVAFGNARARELVVRRQCHRSDNFYCGSNRPGAGRDARMLPACAPRDARGSHDRIAIRVGDVPAV